MQKEDDSKAAFLDAGVAPLKMLKGWVTYWWLNMPSVGHSTTLLKWDTSTTLLLFHEL